MVSDATGTASFIRDDENGFLVKGGDAASLADGLRRLLSNGNRLSEIGKQGYSIYQDNFSLDSFADSVMKVFGEGV